MVASRDNESCREHDSSLEVPTATARTATLTPQQLRDCFAESGLKPLPTLSACQELINFVPLGCPRHVESSGVVMPHRAAAAAETLLKALPDIETYWRAHYAGGLRRSCTTEERARVEHVWNEAVFTRLTDLRRALQRCQGLIEKGPEAFPEDRDAAMDDLLTLFKEAARRVSPKRHFGTSAAGPATAFICAALWRLEYGAITVGAVKQHFQRKRKNQKRNEGSK